MTPLHAALGVLVGIVAGIGSGLFGVGGGIVTTPAINVLLGGTAIQAVATPLPVIFPTSLVGALTYGRAGEVSTRAFMWAIGPGIAGAVAGAALTDVLNVHLLLVITSVLIGWTAVQVAAGRKPRTPWERGKTAGWKYSAIGLAAGFLSGLLGIGGGIVMVPLFTTAIGMPLKRALGTSLATMSALVIPGTIVHQILGHIDWRICAVLAIGVIPGAWIGSKIAIRTRERSLRIAVGSFLLAVAVLYGVRELLALVQG
jgi:uncharacterized membrane protein YfcA